MIQVNASSYDNKAKSFYLIYRYGPSEEYNMLKLKSPSRLARETFLMALGIASYQGNIANLTRHTALFPNIHSVTCNDKNLSDIDLPKPTSRRLFGNSDIDRETPVSKMMAIENELEQDMFMMRDKLEAKNKVVSELHQELTYLHEDLNKSKNSNEECKKSLRLSQRRVE